jgi:hypothetical protein
MHSKKGEKPEFVHGKKGEKPEFVHDKKVGTGIYVQWKESLHSSRKEKRRLQYYLQRV